MIPSLNNKIVPYIETENRILLEKTLTREFVNTGLSMRDIERVVRGSDVSEKSIQDTLIACKETITRYVREKGAVSSGELSKVGGSVLDIGVSIFNDYLIASQTTKEGLTLRKELFKEDIINQRLFSFYTKLTNKIFAFPDVAMASSILWYKDLYQAQSYVINFLTVKEDKSPNRENHIKNIYIKKEPAYINNEPKKKKFNVTVDNNILLKPEDKPVTEVNESIKDVDEFIERYSLKDNTFKGHTPIQECDILEVLIGEGLDKDNLEYRVFTRRIRASPGFAKILMKPQSNLYSKEKIQHIGHEYHNKDYNEKIKFLKVIDSLFNINLK